MKAISLPHVKARTECDYVGVLDFLHDTTRKRRIISHSSLFGRLLVVCNPLLLVSPALFFFVPLVLPLLTCALNRPCEPSPTPRAALPSWISRPLRAEASLRQTSFGKCLARSWGASSSPHFDKQPSVTDEYN